MFTLAMRALSQSETFGTVFSPAGATSGYMLCVKYIFKFHTSLLLVFDNACFFLGKAALDAEVSWSAVKTATFGFVAM